MSSTIPVCICGKTMNFYIDDRMGINRTYNCRCARDFKYNQMVTVRREAEEVTYFQFLIDEKFVIYLKRQILLGETIIAENVSFQRVDNFAYRIRQLLKLQAFS